jgi:hypothetical protein
LWAVPSPEDGRVLETWLVSDRVTCQGLVQGGFKVVKLVSPGLPLSRRSYVNMNGVGLIIILNEALVGTLAVKPDIVPPSKSNGMCKQGCQHE